MSSDHYVRGDGQIMVELRPGEFISETAAARLGLIEPQQGEGLQSEGKGVKRRAKRSSIKRPPKKH